jgi:hypothetical protein
MVAKGNVGFSAVFFVGELQEFVNRKFIHISD